MEKFLSLNVPQQPYMLCLWWVIKVNKYINIVTSLGCLTLYEVRASVKNLC